MIRTVSPVVGGQLTGSTLNATIFGGVAYPASYKNQTLQVPEIRIFGNTSDEVPFFVQEAGTGTPTTQMTRIVSNSLFSMADSRFSGFRVADMMTGTAIRHRRKIRSSGGRLHSCQHHAE